MWLCKIFILFLALSFCGWVYESIYGVIVTHQWEKRGFLNGPICPIYGAGGCGAVILAQLITDKTTGECILTWWQVFLITAVGSAVIEYVTHWALEKHFHMYWWDYSNMPLNLNGRICLPATLLFGVVGVGAVFGLEPFLKRIAPFIPVMLAEFVSLVLMAVLAADITLTVVALTTFADAVSRMEENMNDYMTGMVETMGGKVGNAYEKIGSVGETVKAYFTEEDKERFMSRQMNMVVKNMNSTYRGVIARVQGFGSTATEGTKIRAVKLQQMMKKAWKKNPINRIRKL